jgi:hypothetical protein
LADWTKRDIVKQAFSELGKTENDFDLQPETIQLGLRQLDAMVAQWSIQGIRVGYAGGSGKGDVDADALVPFWAVEGLYLNLALRLAPSFGKTVAPETLRNAREAKDSLRVDSAKPRPRFAPGYAGAGSYNTNTIAPVENLTTRGDSELTLGDNI